MTISKLSNSKIELANIKDREIWNYDCRHFVGGLPCKYWCTCQNCSYYDPITSRILIIMLGRLGDMLIASPLPARIKQENSSTHITWLVDATCEPILKMNSFVDRILAFNWETTNILLSESFDAIYCFERTPSAASLVPRIQATHKSGLAYGGSNNSLYAIGNSAKHFFLMNTWNDYRTKLNSKTWIDLYFEVAGYSYNAEPYILEIPQSVKSRIKTAFSKKNNYPQICLNVGGSLSTKRWPQSQWMSLGRSLVDIGCHLIITGGPNDKVLCETLTRDISKVDKYKKRVRYKDLDIEEFSVIPSLCDVMVTGDTFGFHLAIAHQCPCVLLLGPSNGVEVIPKHIKFIKTLQSTYPCSPCAHQVTCQGVGGCMEAIHADHVLKEVKNLIIGIEQ